MDAIWDMECLVQGHLCPGSQTLPLAKSPLPFCPPPPSCSLCWGLSYALILPLLLASPSNHLQFPEQTTEKTERKKERREKTEKKREGTHWGKGERASQLVSGASLSFLYLGPSSPIRVEKGEGASHLLALASYWHHSPSPRLP